MDCGSRVETLAAAIISCRLDEVLCPIELSVPTGQSYRSVLPINGEAGAAVLLPAFFRGLGAEWLLFAIAHNANAVGSDARLHQRLLGGVGAALAQREVVFVGATLVAVSAYQHFDVGVLRKVCRRFR